MNETEFNALAGAVLARIEQQLERCGADLDCSPVGDGVLEIEFADGSKMVVNRHVPAREIWVAGRSGGYHFRWDGLVWRDTRDESELMAVLSQLVSRQAGETVHLD